MNTPQYWTLNLVFRFRPFRIAIACALFSVAAIGLRADETNNTSIAVTKVGETTNATDALRSFLQLQEQLHATQLALERNHQESETLAARNAEAVAARLQIIEQAMSSQRAKELEAMQSANRLLLIVAGSFAGVGFIAMLLTAYFQWRAVNRLADFLALLPVTGRAALPAPSQTETQLVNSGLTAQSNARMFGALSRLEKRILELEHTTHHSAGEKSSTLNEIASAGATGQTPLAGAEANDAEKGSHIALLLAKGQSLLNLDKATEALACYDEILAQAPNHPEALVKKGIALEQLRQIDDALLCYDRAIAADGSLTVAYLQKGGLFNRLERYEEALQCYEEALRTQEKAREA